MEVHSSGDEDEDQLIEEEVEEGQKPDAQTVVEAPPRGEFCAIQRVLLLTQIG